MQVVGGAIVDSLEEPTRLLAARRTAPPAFAGQWEFPGGKVEPGEGHEAALRRELAEELGVEVRLGPEVVGAGPEGWPLNEKAAMRVWFAEVTAGVPAALEDHDELRWVALDDGVLDDGVLGERLADPGQSGEELPWIPADYPIVAAVRSLAARLRAGGDALPQEGHAQKS